MYKKHQNFLFIFTIPLLLTCANYVMAAGIVPDGGKKSAGNYGLGDFVVLLINISNYILLITGSLALLAFIVGGTMLLLSGGSGEMVTRGRQAFTGAIIGLVIVFTSWSVIGFFTKTMGYDEAEFGKWNEAKVDTQVQDLETSTLTTAWTFDPGISNQVSDASTELMGLLDCMRSNLPAGIGRISSISDSKYVGNLDPCDSYVTCPTEQCVHSCASCHYGGGTGVGKSYAVDLGDEENKTAIYSAINSCITYIGNINDHVVDEGDHIHISVKECPKK